MAAEKQTENSKEVVKVSREDVGSSGRTSSISLAGNATYGIQEGDSDQELVANQDVYYPPTSTCGYFYPGYNGTFSKWYDQGYFVTQEGLELPCPTSQLKSGILPVDAARGYYPAGKFSSLPNQGQGGLFQRNCLTNFRSNGQSLVDSDRFKMRQKFNRNRDREASGELICGPRVNRGKGKGSLAEKDCLSFLIRKDQYNLQDFEINYEQAKFFMIKSFCEDDIHKSIKYSVWASTPNGNKKLDVAFRDAEARIKEKAVKCPIFLFFSVNGSGQFVGLAEMIGPVDFKKSMDFWHQDKWNGFFPVKWHIIKDIPNCKFQNITLENNDNKCVTFSRDTQEIRLPQGLKLLHIFKNYPPEKSILDDFGFYEEREKSLRARRSGGTALPHLEVASNIDDSSLEHLDVAMRKMQL